MELLSSPYWKFRAINASTFRMFLNREFWFANPSTFNDPFDNTLRAIDLVKPLADDLPNGADLLARLKQIEDEVRANLLAFCVCSRKNAPSHPVSNVLMWSHYADSHRGICVGLSMNSFSGGSLPTVLGSESLSYSNLPVYYGTETPEAYARMRFGSGSEGQLASLVSKVVYVKSSEWKYENEHRFQVRQTDNNTAGQAFAFRPEDVESIIFGMVISEHDERAVRHLFDASEWAHVSFWRAVRGDGWSELAVVPA